MKKYYSNDFLYIVRGFENDRYKPLPMVEYNDGTTLPALYIIQSHIDYLNDDYTDIYKRPFTIYDITVTDKNKEHWYIINNGLLTRIDW